MSEKNCGTLMLLTLVAGLCALALGSPAPKWCGKGVVATLVMACEKVASR